jgi:hypothetical protein
MERLKIAVLVLSLGFAAICAAREQPKGGSFRPPTGYIPDKETALTVAIAVLTPIYGKELVDREQPFRVTEKKGVWVITGAPPPALGGVAEIHISRQTGEILFLMHSK